MIIQLQPDILECEVKWALGNITINKASRGDGIPVQLFQILKDDVVQVLHSICQQIWKTQQWPQDWKRLLPCPGYYKQCCDEHWGTRVSFPSGFLSVYAQQWDCSVRR